MLISLTNPRTLPSIFHCWRQWRHSTAPPAARGFVPRCASIGQLNRGSSQEYFADGMTEERIGRLSNIRGLRVISHTSAMQYKHTLLSAPEIARTLRVDALVEGSVIRKGSRIRVQAQLIRGATDAEHRPTD